MLLKGKKKITRENGLIGVNSGLVDTKKKSFFKSSFTTFFIIFILLTVAILLDYSWRKAELIEPNSSIFISQSLEVSNSNYLDKITTFTDGFLGSQLTKLEDLSQYSILSLKNEDLVISVYNLDQKDLVYLKQLYPELEVLPKTQQKLFYINSASKTTQYLSLDWLPGSSKKIQKIVEYNFESKNYWISMESSRLIISEPKFVNPVSISLVNSNKQDLVVTNIISSDGGKVCVQVVDNTNNSLNKQLCYKLYPNGKYELI